MLNSSLHEGSGTGLKSNPPCGLDVIAGPHVIAQATIPTSTNQVVSENWNKRRRAVGVASDTYAPYQLIAIVRYAAQADSVAVAAIANAIPTCRQGCSATFSVDAIIQLLIPKDSSMGTYSDRISECSMPL